MTKNELNKTIAERVGTTPAIVEKTLAVLGVLISKTVNTGDELVVPSLGKFAVKHRDSRAGRNPQTGEPLQTAPKNSVVFKPGKELRDKIEQPTA